MLQKSIKLGLMNNPKNKLDDEIERIGKAGFDFIDLVLEPPQVARRKLKVTEVKKHLQKNNLFALGHTWYEMHYAFPNKKIGDMFIKELKDDIAFFSKIDSPIVAVHLDDKYKQLPKEQIFDYHLLALEIISSYAKQLGIQLVVENVPDGKLSNPKDVSKLLKANSDIGLLLDIGHANTISESAVWEFFKLCGKRIKHIHISDNNGKDEHLPIGLGSISWKKLIANLDRIDYKNTITFEIFARNAESDIQLEYQKNSRNLFLELIDKHV